ncbi:HypC/HybG/HupF family hydrogenase formation chaperone [Vibrio variabilis]|uniref:HypC/HybG/HupF family hydrogenase formation chaperone n=1 Tax=Vibrio variabilis TaxID=990271 RepID=UPI000DD61091|nr:HypC/HybG/HupF family hydrogenase formation chaperone [Vibrio variabilis]
MCLGIPSEVVQIGSTPNSVIVNTLGVKREVNTELIEANIELGEYLLIHVGFAIGKISVDKAKQTLQDFDSILAIQEGENS